MYFIAFVADFLADINLNKWDLLMLLTLAIALSFSGDSKEKKSSKKEKKSLKLESYPPKPSCFNCKNHDGLPDSICFRNINFKKVPYPYVKNSKDNSEIDKARYNASRCSNYRF